MKHVDFAHLHVHTQYSLLDGACQLPRLIKMAKKHRMPAVAMTDHGNMFGAIEFYQHAISGGVKPIIGCEVYLAPESRFEKSSHGIQEAAFHLILLAKDETGYKNLLKLVSAGYLEGFYYRPRIDKELLSKHSKGLVCFSACLAGEISHLILTKQLDQARRVCDEYRSIFEKGDFYLELQDNKIPEQNEVNKELITLSKDLSIPLIATGDVHYLEKEDARAHEALLCIQTQTTLDDPQRMRFQTDEFYFKSYDEISRNLGREAPESITNTIEVVEKCNLEFDFKETHLPQYQPPKGIKKEAYLRQLCNEGLRRRFDNIDSTIEKRVDHELELIKKAGYTSYFLIAWDFISYAKSKGIPVGPGRGSAAGSLVSYSLGITDINPLDYDLLFERFLNPERVSLPDIDIDFCYERRGEVIEYVTQKYGKDNVAQIITFGTMGPKAIIRDVGRVMAIPYADVDRIAKLVPNELNITLKAALDGEPELKKLYEEDPQITTLINTSLSLEGLTRHASTHAAGVVISDKPLSEYIPLFKSKDDQITTGFSMGSLEKIGLLKMDFLGLRTLTVISEALKIIKRTRGEDINIEKIVLNDKKTYELLSRSESIGVFQLESSGMRDILRKLKPERFEDIIALLALFRPGPIGSGMVDDFMARKHGKIEIVYDHPSLEPVLKDTYGIIIYQEQVMRIASDLAGFSLSQADSLRRAMAKKTPEVMTEARKHFIDGAIRNGVDIHIADKTFNLIEYFAGYGFNKSHSAAYAMISYRTAYLKANYPIEFMTALLTSEKDNTDKVALYIKECEHMGIEVLPPDVNESFARFTVVDEVIRFGLAAVKNVGHGAIESIIAVRKKEGRFESLYEFCERIDSRLVNRKVIESLIKCGAFDSIGLHRSQMMAIIDRALEVAGDVQKDRHNGQLSFFDTFEDEDDFKKTFQKIPQIPEWPENQLLAFEKALLGFYVTKHPLMRYERILRSFSTRPMTELASLRDGEEVFLGGIISKLKLTTTKRTGEKMAILTLEDLDGSIETLVFPSAFQGASKHMRMDALVFIKGRISLREEESKLMANELVPMEEVQQRYTKSVDINIVTTGFEKESLNDLKGVLATYRGSIPVYLNLLHGDEKRTRVAIGRELYVKPSHELIEKIEEMLGEGAVTFSSSN
ncbi:MAG: DNA polymerase III subunit alpha [Candidatus Omnitrophica bacterium]|nr:DNA polymerase III subunit alpha [Candidatus Omnitrophota bacterium]